MKFLDQHNLFTRSDTIFGVCQGFGEDLGVPPNLLRLGLGFLLFLNPLAALFTYVAAGAVVALSRWLFPVSAAAPAAPAAVEVQPAREDEAEPLPLAA
jgi:phage shock protein PspC (stress-responsive transcriptional regulator)